eukprot:m.860085 g.860085  ORF g.860085 m.860085 type:complete len:862 (-) comp23527_c0_seq8:171-2756(-)
MGSPTPGRTLRRAVHFVRSWWWVITGVWMLSLAAGIFKGLELMKATTIVFAAPKGSQAEIGQAKFEELFPISAARVPILLVLERLDELPFGDGTNSNEKYINTSNVIQATNASITRYLQENPDAQYLFPAAAAPFVEFVPCPQVASAWGALLISVSIPPDEGLQGKSLSFSKYIISQKDEIVDSVADFSGAKIRSDGWLTGMLVFGVEVTDGTEHDIMVMDGTGLPLAMIVLAIVLQSLRLLILPILVIVTSLMTSFLIVWPIALHVDVISFAPSVMCSVVLAMSIDYSLFLLSRYREELKRGRTPNDSVVYMVWSAGHTIVVSGSTLMLCFLSLVMFPSVMLRSMGFCCAIALFVTILCNLTLTTAILVGFESFFKAAILPCAWGCRGRSTDTDGSTTNVPSEKDPLFPHGGDIQNSALYADEGMSSQPSPMIPLHAELEADVRLTKRTRWYRFAVRIIRHPILISFVLLGLACGCAYRAVRFDKTLSIISYTPRYAEGTYGFQHLSQHFGSGDTFPYYIIVESTSEHPGITGTEAVENATMEMFSLLDNDQDEFPFTLPVALNNWTADGAFAFVECSFSPANRPAQCNDAFHYNTTTDYIDASITALALVDDPFKGRGLHFYSAAIDKAQRVEKTNPGTGVYIIGGASINIDAVDGVYDRFPIAIGVTAVFVLVWIGIAFRSVLIPMRSVLTIAVTLTYVFAVATWVYEYGALDWLRLSSLKEQAREVGEDHGAICWIVPVMCFSVLVGLGLDYDVFLISRVVEFRRQGLSNRAAIVMGVCKTGGIITAAGGIMAIAFAGLLFSQEPVLNELSFFLVFAVLVDTFVIRLLLVPALMVLLGDSNWWPGTVPNTPMDLDDF